ncbi:Geranial dehydrogenase [Paraconexibacter sp. AEG42_29]|uniref:Geranial dehydrogenase n=1 Tax=Paraconexibacter sp. AEG42_29 TaxID=2997339 RepID=A0AAU7B1I8_9ACTN
MSTQTLIESNELFIGGGWVSPQGSDRIDVFSASTEELIGSVPDGTNADIDAAATAARNALQDPQGWSSWSVDERASAMERLADAMDKRSEEMTTRISMQNGMPIAIAQQLEGVFPQVLLRYYAGLVRGTDFEEERAGLLGGTIIVKKQPIGVVGAIVPWNFPQALAAFKLAPLLAAGCTVVMKPSPETVLDSLTLAEAIIEAGIPDGVINIVPGGREVGAYLVEHPQIDKVAFTGSTPAGRKIAARCGELLRPVTLELGGKSAAIVLDDADIASSVENLFSATLLNNGQTCFLGTRVLAPRSKYDEVLAVFGGLADALTVGDSMDPATQIGPMASKRQQERVEGYIAKGKSEGARVVAGGRPTGQEQGWFVQPTIFADVENSHTIAQEEIFGPVLSVIPYDNDEQAIAIANDSEFGLGGSVWTGDAERGEAMARRVQTGSIGINHYMIDPAAPFGGVKQSGLGKELGPEGLQAYLSTQSIYKTQGGAGAGAP